MQSFTTLTSTFIPVPYNDVDTDQIIPAEYLKVTSKDGLVEGLFQRWRYQPDGTANPDFPLNQPEYQGAQILLAGDNFGCGSSREHAPWALQGWGFKAIISTSFADIFRNNALKNGLLPVAVDAETHEQLLEMSTESPHLQLTIDLANQIITLPNGRTTSFPIDGFSKTCLLEGLDQLGYLLKQTERVAEYEQRMGR
ncbi:MAG: 3-isopropylmalate dehydratase small subunit [Chloroflexi bacterium]|nr:3-isopropylmalate dehydratase small subunit [Chloroflexota bacterium]MBP8060135.1 3-isopropylmalate dehydratase small subunit [Chloroflexota bacterium]